jgi:hypothetical protein
VNAELSAFAVQVLTENTKWDGDPVVENEFQLNEENWKKLRAHVEEISKPQL